MSSDFSCEYEPIEARTDPVGASNEFSCCFNENDKTNYLNTLERDKEKLNSSLIALTTHFAQVQFRLRQVIHAPPEAKEDLLQSLEEFASQGIPDIGMLKERKDEKTLMTEIYLRRRQQEKVFSVLKKQLTELKEYALRSREAISHENLAIKQHKIIMRELKSKIKLDIDENIINIMPPDAISKEISTAVDQVVIMPIKRKEMLVNQLKEQIADLERFVEYLQTTMRKNQLRNQSSSPGVFQKLASVLDIYSTLQFSCSYRQFQKDQQDATLKNQDYTLLKTKLNKSISRIKSLMAANPKGITNMAFNIKLTKIVRKTLAVSLKKLIQHGTRCSSSTVLTPFNICCLRKSPVAINKTQIHAWDILLKYLELKEIKTPESIMTNLLKSYNLDPVNSSETSPRAELLWCIKTIISLHQPYKKDSDSQFKAFVCSALNVGKLAFWLSSVFSQKQLVEAFFMPWSYVAKTGFKDSLESLDSLAAYKFNLMVDIAVRHYQNIKDICY